MPVSINNTQVVFNDATVQTTAGYPNTNPSGFTSNTGTVTSVATGNGLQGGTITTSGTLSIACPTHNTVGSYIFCYMDNGTFTFGANYAAGGGTNQLGTSAVNQDDVYGGIINNSGTWKWLGASIGQQNVRYGGIACRVS